MKRPPSRVPGPFPGSAAQYLTTIDVVRIEGANWKRKVLARLGNYQRPPAVLSRVFDLVQHELNARTVLIEPYISTDWADEYASWYARVFRNIPRWATRLHFFAGVGTSGKHSLTKMDLFNFPPECTETRGSAYLGYCVVRPFEPLTVADTVLVSPYRNNEFAFVHCLAPFTTHLLGHELKVNGMPFIQQERAVSVCAEADLWMVTRFLHAEGETRRYRPSEMAKFATRAISLGSAREGLAASQMCTALREMDLNPHLLTPTSPAEALMLISACVDSEVPVIVGIPGHVLTVIGHSYSAKKNGLKISDSAAAYVDFLVAHDDERGPYLKLNVGRARRSQRNYLTLDGDPVEWCLIPMPARVHLREEDVRRLLKRWVEEEEFARSFESRLPKEGRKRLWRRTDFAGLSSRIYLRRSDHFKMDIYPSRKDDPRREIPYLRWRSHGAVARYWAQILPRYVWVVELSRDRSWYDPKKQRIVGEVVFDATAHHQDFANCLLALHLKGRMLYRDSSVDDARETVASVQDTRPWKFVDELDDEPFSPLVRYC